MSTACKLVDSTWSTSVPDESLITTRAEISDRLIVSIDSREYEWFLITPNLIDEITIDLFMTAVESFFAIPVHNQVISDLDSLILTTTDLRRLLRSANPQITITSYCMHEESPRKAPLPTRQLFQIQRGQLWGFTTVLSPDRSKLVISKILPDSNLKGIARVGDAITRVNNQRDVWEMRSELCVSQQVTIEISPTVI